MYLLDSEKSNESFPLRATVQSPWLFSAVTMLSTVFIGAQPLSGSRTIIVRYTFLITCYESVQKRTFARRAHFETPQLSIFRRLARHLLFQLFSLHPCAPKCVKTVSLETRPRMFVRVSAFISPFDLSSFDMDFGLSRDTFSRFSFSDLNFWKQPLNGSLVDRILLES